MLLLVFVLAVGLMACTTESEDSPNDNEPPAMDEDIIDDDENADDDPSDEGALVLSPEELAEYDGKDGNPAYIAVDGVIYDVTDSDLWEEGTHNGFEAGQDLTDGLFDESPHGDSVLDRLTIVGTLED